MTLDHLYLVSPEWALGALDLEPPVLLLSPIDPLVLLVAESERKLLWLKEQLGSKLAGELVPVSALVPAPVPSISRMARPPLSTRRTGRVCIAP